MPGSATFDCRVRVEERQSQNLPSDIQPSRELIPRPVCYDLLSMIRMPRTLVALFMAFALFLQASGGSACAVRCLLGSCESNAKQDQSSKDSGCCADGQQDTHHGAEEKNQHKTGHQAKCDCGVMSSCDNPAPVAVNIAFLPQFDSPGILPEPLEFAQGMSQVQEPGHYGNDNGPPPAGPKYASFGRAPPVLLA